MYKAIIFDMDGTISNTLPLAIEAFRQAFFPTFNRNLTDEEITSRFGASEESTVEMLAPNAYAETLNAYWDNLIRLHKMCDKPFDGIVEIIEFLKKKGVKVCLVTGRAERSTFITLKHFGMENVFEKIGCGIKEKNIKKECICEIKDAYDLVGDEILYVGDTRGDIRQSRAAGVKVASALWSENSEKDNILAENPDYAFFTIEAFRKFLDKHYKKS